MLFVIELSLGGRNGKDVGTKFKHAQIDVKTTEKETKETQRMPTKQIDNNCDIFNLLFKVKLMEIVLRLVKFDLYIYIYL